jgi:hypothetical protein
VTPFKNFEKNLLNTRTGRNEDYIYNSMKFSRGVVITAGIISMVPKIFKPYGDNYG